MKRTSHYHPLQLKWEWRSLPFGVLPWHFAGIHRPFNGCRKLPTINIQSFQPFRASFFLKIFWEIRCSNEAMNIYIYILYNIYIYMYIIYVIRIIYMYHIYIYHMYMTIWLSPFFKKRTPYQTSSPSFLMNFCWILFPGLKPEDRVLKRVVWNFLHRLSAPTPLSGDVAGNLDAPGPVVGPWRSTWRLVRRIFGVEQRLQNRAEMWLEWWLLWKKTWMNQRWRWDGKMRGGCLISIFTMTFDTSMVGIVSFLLCRFFEIWDCHDVHKTLR